MNLAQVADPDTLLNSEEKIPTPKNRMTRKGYSDRRREHKSSKHKNKNPHGSQAQTKNSRTPKAKQDNQKSLVDKWGEKRSQKTGRQPSDREHQNNAREHGHTNVSYENNQQNESYPEHYNRKDSNEDDSAYKMGSNQQISFRSLIKTQNAMKMQNSEYEDFLREIKEVSSAEEESRVIKEGQTPDKHARVRSSNDYETKKNKIKKRADGLKGSQEELVDFDTAKFSGFSSFEFNSKLTLESPLVTQTHIYISSIWARLITYPLLISSLLSAILYIK